MWYQLAITVLSLCPNKSCVDTPIGRLSLNRSLVECVPELYGYIRAVEDSSGVTVWICSRRNIEVLPAAKEGKGL